VEQQIVEPVELVDLESVVLVQYQGQVQLLLLLIQEAVEADVNSGPTLLVMVVQELLF
jgi:hypothetical protein